MADFLTSTHRANWIFTPDELAEKYRAANQRALEALEKYGATRMDVDIDGSISYPKPQVITDKADKHSKAKPLTVEEEKLLRVFYEYKIQDACHAFEFPHKVQATAIIYFKMFYLQWSVMQHYPKNIMLTCIYAACKIEENHVSAEELGKVISQDHQMILNNEMIVYQSIDFDLIVYAPYRSIQRFINDMEEFCDAERQLQLLLNLSETEKVEVDKTMLSDAPLPFPPGKLALAALRSLNEVHGVLDFESYLKSVLSRQNSGHAIFELNEFLDAIDTWVAKLYIPTADDLKHIDRKVKSCLDPSSNDKSKKEKKSKHKSKKRSSEVLLLLEGACKICLKITVYLKQLCASKEHFVIIHKPNGIGR